MKTVFNQCAVDFKYISKDKELLAFSIIFLSPTCKLRWGKNINRCCFVI
jgi:hypothetical protein